MVLGNSASSYCANKHFSVLFAPYQRLRELELFSLAKKTLWRDFIVIFQNLKGAYMQKEDQLFTQAGSNRTQGNVFKLNEEKFRLDVGKNFFTQSVVRY